MNDDLIIRSRARHEFEKFFTDSERLQHDCDSILCMIPAVDAVEVVPGLQVFKGISQSRKDDLSGQLPRLRMSGSIARRVHDCFPRTLLQLRRKANR